MVFREAIKLDLSLTLRFTDRSLQSGFPCRMALKQDISFPLKLSFKNFQAGFPCKRATFQALYFNDGREISPSLPPVPPAPEELFQKVGRLTTEVLYQYAQHDSAVINCSNGFAYFASHKTPLKIYKIRLFDFTLSEDSPFISSWAHSVYCFAAAIDKSNGFAYFAGSRPEKTFKILKIRLSDFTEAAAADVSGLTTAYCAVIDEPNAFLYLGGLLQDPSGDKYKIIKVRLSDFAVLSSIEFDKSKGVPHTMVIDLPNSFIYVGTYGIPAYVVKIDLSVFETVDSIGLSPDGQVSCSIIDQPNGYAYFGLYYSESGNDIIRLKLSDFTIDGTLNLPSGEESVLSASVDLSEKYAYFGSVSGKVIKVNLSDFTRKESIQLYMDSSHKKVEDPYLSVIDPVNKSVYFGTGKWPSAQEAYVIKVACGEA